MPISVATYNVHHRREDAGIHQDILKLIALGSDVVNLQEMVGHDAALDNLPKGWRAWQPAVPAGETLGVQDTPILYNLDTFTSVRRGFRHVSDPCLVEPDDDAGGNDVASKNVVWVRLRHKETGRVCTFMNTHAVAGVEHNGRPDSRRPKRLHVFAQLMNRLEEMIMRRVRQGESVFVAGDLNVDYHNDRRIRDNRFPFAVLGGVGMVASHQELGMSDQPTKGGRWIDYVYYTPGANRVHPLHQHVYSEGFGSDHHPLILTCQLGA